MEGKFKAERERESVTRWGRRETDCVALKRDGNTTAGFKGVRDRDKGKIRLLEERGIEC